MPLKKRTSNIVITKLARWERHVLDGLFAAAYLLVLARLWWPMGLPGKTSWLAAVLLMVAVVSTIASLSRHLPFQNVLFTAVFIGLSGAGANLLGGKTGIPFGAFTLDQSSGPKLFAAVPWVIPAIWILAILNSRGVARLILRPWRKLHAYGFWLIGVTTGLTVLFDVAFEPFASRVNHFWFWEPAKFPLTWQGVPLVNFLGWLVVTLLIMAFITPTLINKHPVHRRPPDYHPLAVWLGGVFLFAVGSATAGMWSAVALDGIIGVGVAIMAIRGSRW